MSNTYELYWKEVTNFYDNPKENFKLNRNNIVPFVKLCLDPSFEGDLEKTTEFKNLCSNATDLLGKGIRYLQFCEVNSLLNYLIRDFALAIYELDSGHTRLDKRKFNFVIMPLLVKATLLAIMANFNKYNYTELSNKLSSTSIR